MTTRKRIRWRGRSWTYRLAAVAGLVTLSGGGLLQAASDDLRLVEAVKAQRWEAVPPLLADRADVNATQGDGATALHWAVYWDDHKTAELLIRAGAGVDAANAYEVTPLWLACANASGPMVERLLAAGADARATLTTGETALMACARTGSVDAVKALLSRGVEVDAREASESQTALMWAAAQRHPAVVRLLLEHGADPHARSRIRREVISRRLQSDLRYGERSRSLGSDAEETDIGGFTPLLFAARVGDLESARLLLAAGADVNDTGPDGASALVVATHSGHRALARFLLERGANPNAAIVGYTALHAAVLQGDLKVVEALLDHGASPNAQITQGTRVARNGQVLYLGEHLLGATPFALAAKFIEVKIMRVLLDAGADAALPLKNGWTPVSLAAGAGWRYGTWDRRDRALIRLPAAQHELYDERRTLEAVKMAAEAGSDVNAVDEDGNTALHYVVDKGFPDVVAFLTESGAKVNVENKRGQTPLTRFARRRPEVSDEATRATGDLLHGLGAR